MSSLLKTSWVFYSGFFVCCLIAGWYGSQPQPKEPKQVEQITLYSKQAGWWQPGDRVGSDGTVVAGLGFIAIAPAHQEIYAPFDGKTTLDVWGCVLFTSPDLPNNKLRLCQLNEPQLKDLKKGESIAKTKLLLVSTLKKTGSTWATVEPVAIIIEGLLTSK